MLSAKKTPDERAVPAAMRKRKSRAAATAGPARVKGAERVRAHAGTSGAHRRSSVAYVSPVVLPEGAMSCRTLKDRDRNSRIEHKAPAGWDVANKDDPRNRWSVDGDFAIGSTDEEGVELLRTVRHATQRLAYRSRRTVHRTAAVAATPGKPCAVTGNRMACMYRYATCQTCGMM